MDPVQPVNVSQVAAHKGGKVAKAAIATAIVAGAAVLAAAAHKGDVFSKVKNVVTNAEGKNVFEKAKSVLSGENIKKGVNAMKEGFKKLPEAAKELPATAKKYGEKAVDWVKSKLPKAKEAAEKVAE